MATLKTKIAKGESMQFKSYGTKKTVSSRMARKRLRRDVFIFNKKAAPMRRKALRLAKKEYE